MASYAESFVGLSIWTIIVAICQLRCLSTMCNSGLDE